MRLPILLPAIFAVATASAQFAKLPLRFEPNLGQAPADTLFQARGPRQTLSLARDGATLQVVSAGEDPRLASVRLTWLGSAGAVAAEPGDKLPGVSHYYIGDRPSAWRTHIPHYARVTLREVYPGIDLAYYGNEGRLEYDFIVAPHADPSRIQFRVDGADRVALTPEGDLLLDTAAGPVRWRQPATHQTVGGARRAIASRYTLDPAQRTVRFELGAYDRALPLVIDPVLIYSTLLGGVDNEISANLALDPSGNAYLAGTTYSRNIPASTPIIAGRSLKGLYDGVVSKLNAAGTQVVYTTYLGGEDLDIINAIAVDARGAAYIGGPTTSYTFPLTAESYNRARRGFSDVYLVKLNPDGTLGYGTLFGGPGNENLADISVDAQGSAFAVGYTTDPVPTTANAAQRLFGGGKADAFVFRLNPEGTDMNYVTHFGGTGSEEPSLSQAEFLPRLAYAFDFGIAIDGLGNAWIAGSTTSADLPVTSKNVGLFKGGITDLFLAKLNPEGSEFTSVSYLGGGALDVYYNLAIDQQGNAHLAGMTTSRNFPTTDNALQKAFLGGESDGFYTKVAADGASLLYSTYFGGNADDLIAALAVNPAGEIFFAGNSASRNFPVTADALDPGPPRRSSPFLSVLNPAGSALLSSGFFGGPDANSFNAINLDAESNIYVGGMASGPGFTTTIGSSDPTYNGGLYDFFVAKFAKLGSTPAPGSGPSPCAFTLDPGSLDLTGDAIVAEVAVRTGVDCTWTVAAPLPWATFVGVRDRKGAGVVYLNVAINPDTPRAGVVQIAGRDFTIRQARRDTALSQAALTPIVTTLAGNGTRGGRTDPGPAKAAQFGAVSGVAFDNRGNLYISDAENHLIRRVRPDGIIELWAGIVGIPAFSGDGGPAIRARLNEPEGLAVDAAGNLYIADKGNRRIRKITPDGETITTIAGNGLVGQIGQDGDGEAALRASFREPANLLIDAAGNLLISDRGSNRIRRITFADGNINTVVGTGESGFGGDGQPAIRARILNPAGMAIDRQGLLYFSDQFNHRIRRVLANGNIETVAGNGIAAWGGDNRPAVEASLNSPFGVAFDRDGLLYITDRDNHRIRRVDARGIINQFAGDGNAGFLGDDVAPNVTRFAFPSSLVSDAAGNLVLADSGNGSLRVRKIAFPLPPAPVTQIRSILNAFGGQAAVSPLALAAIYGENFTKDTVVAEGALPFELGGIRVNFNNRAAAISFVSPHQINFIVPIDLNAGPVPVAVSTPANRGTATVFLTEVSPGLQSVAIGERVSPVAYFDGESVLVAPPGSIPDRESRNARAGDTIILIATGLGLTDPLPEADKPITDPLPLAGLDRLAIAIGDKPAEILSALMVSPGVFQVRARIPEEPGKGFQPLKLTIRDQPAQSGLQLSLEE